MAGKKKSSKILIGLSMLVASAIPAKLLKAQTLQCPVWIIYGTIMGCSGAGTVTVDPDGVRSTGGAPCLSVSGPAAQGRCIVQQALFPLRPVQISVSAAATITNGAQNMNVDNFDLISVGNGPTVTVTAFLTAVGIGSTLHVGANQAQGNYTGSVTINANFQ